MILNAFNLQGKVALVTGCDKGLGQGMALGLAEAGLAALISWSTMPGLSAGKTHSPLVKKTGMR